MRAPFDVTILECPACRASLAFDVDHLVCPAGHGYPVSSSGEGAFADFSTDSDDPVLAAQRAVYDTTESRYAQEGSSEPAAFMESFIRSRLSGQVKAKDELLVRGLRRLGLSASSRALEVGCNDGRFVNLLVGLHGCRGVGIDLSSTAVRQALRSRGPASRTEYHVAEASSLPFRDGTYDVVISFDVFEHLGRRDFVRTMRECHRVLQPGGRLLVYVVSQKDRFTLHETLRRISNGRLGVDDQEGHSFENFIHPDSFRDVARETQFSVEELRAYHGFWTLFAEEFLHNSPPRLVYRWLELLDLLLTRREYGNGFLAVARRN